jgi:drug/metabolite transporter (DMT)-like permease
MAMSVFLFLHEFLTVTQISVASLYAFLIGLVRFGLFFSALRKIKALLASSLAYIEVPSGVLLGVLLFGEVLEWNMVVGGVLVLISAFLLRWE